MLKILSDLKKELKSRFKDDFTGLVLFGSYARNTQTKNSDLDILLIFDKLPPGRLERIRLVSGIIDPIEKKYKIDINPIIKLGKELKKTPLLMDIAEYAKILHDTNNSIKPVFDSIRKDYANGQIVKERCEDSYVLKVNNA